MLRKVVFAVSTAVLLLGLCLGSFAAGDTVPGPSPTPPAPPAAGAPAAVPGPIVVRPSLLTPSPCIVNALRILSSERMPMFDERLKLTDDQHKKIQDILTKTEEDLKPYIQTQKQAAEGFVTGLTKPGMQEQDIQATADNAMKAESAILTQKIKELLAVRSLLQPEQIKEFNNMIEQMTTIWRLGGSPGPRFPAQPGASTTIPAPPATPRTLPAKPHGPSPTPK